MRPLYLISLAILVLVIPPPSNMGKAGTSSAAQPNAGRVGPSDAAGLPRGADLVLLHGKIWTGEPYAGPGQKATPAAFVEAVAMASDRILAVGSSDEIRSYAGPNTRVVDLEGRFAVPGFIDDHVHFIDRKSVV